MYAMIGAPSGRPANLQNAVVGVDPLLMGDIPLGIYPRNVTDHNIVFTRAEEALQEAEFGEKSFSAVVKTWSREHYDDDLRFVDGKWHSFRVIDGEYRAKDDLYLSAVPAAPSTGLQTAEEKLARVVGDYIRTKTAGDTFVVTETENSGNKNLSVVDIFPFHPNFAHYHVQLNPLAPGPLPQSHLVSECLGTALKLVHWRRTNVQKRERSFLRTAPLNTAPQLSHHPYSHPRHNLLPDFYSAPLFEVVDAEFSARLAEQRDRTANYYFFYTQFGVFAINWARNVGTNSSALQRTVSGNSASIRRISGGPKPSGGPNLAVLKRNERRSTEVGPTDVEDQLALRATATNTSVASAFSIGPNTTVGRIITRQTTSSSHKSTSTSELGPGPHPMPRFNVLTGNVPLVARANVSVSHMSRFAETYFDGFGTGPESSENGGTEVNDNCVTCVAPSDDPFGLSVVLEAAETASAAVSRVSTRVDPLAGRPTETAPHKGGGFNFLGFNFKSTGGTDGDIDTNAKNRNSTPPLEVPIDFASVEPKLTNNRFCDDELQMFVFGRTLQVLLDGNSVPVKNESITESSDGSEKLQTAISDLISSSLGSRHGIEQFLRTKMKADPLFSYVFAKSADRICCMDVNRQTVGMRIVDWDDSASELPFVPPEQFRRYGLGYLASSGHKFNPFKSSFYRNPNNGNGTQTGSTNTHGPGRLDLLLGLATGEIVWLDVFAGRLSRVNEPRSTNTSKSRPLGEESEIGTGKACLAVTWVPLITDLPFCTLPELNNHIWDRTIQVFVTGKRLFAAGFADGSVKVFDASAANGIPDKSIPQTQTQTSRISQQADTAGKRHIRIRRSLYDTARSPNPGQLLASYDVATAAVTALQFSPNGKYLLIADAAGYLRIVDFYREAVLHVFRSVYGGILSAAWSPDGRFVAVGGQDDAVSLYAMPFGGADPKESCNVSKLSEIVQDPQVRLICRGLGHKSWVRDVKFDEWRCELAEETYRLGSVGDDGRLLLWEFSPRLIAKPKGGASASGRRRSERAVSVSSGAAGLYAGMLRPQHVRNVSSLSGFAVDDERDDQTEPDGDSPVCACRVHDLEPQESIPLIQPIFNQAVAADRLSQVIFHCSSVSVCGAGGVVRSWSRPDIE